MSDKRCVGCNKPTKNRPVCGKCVIKAFNKASNDAKSANAISLMAWADYLQRRSTEKAPQEECLSPGEYHNPFRGL